MRAVVEVSMYPLTDDYIPPIDVFLEKIRTYPEVKVSTNPSSTRIIGEYDEVMRCVNESMKNSYESGVKATFVMKVLNNPADKTKWDD
jgi:uncharacterized protein YqgV (UPF0045/DUF77 family)